ncbi:hypothetical protein [Amycolatopsis sp. lyj-109]
MVWPFGSVCVFTRSVLSYVIAVTAVAGPAKSAGDRIDVMRWLPS